MTERNEPTNLKSDALAAGSTFQALLKAGDSQRLFEWLQTLAGGKLPPGPPATWALELWVCLSDDEELIRTVSELQLKLGAVPSEIEQRWGNRLMRLCYQTDDPEKSLRLCCEAAEHFRSSLALAPDNVEVMRSCANALDTIGNETEDPVQAVAACSEAVALYRRLRETDPDDAECISNLGQALTSLACSEGAEDNDPRFAEARALLEKAVEMAPDLPRARMALAHDLMEEADELGDEMAASLYHSAIEHLQVASRLAPEDHEPLFKWGRALTQLADRAKGAEQEAYRQQAIEQYRRAIEIEPSDTRSLHNWGSELHQMALNRNGEERDSLFSAARERYLAALKTDPGTILTPWNLARMEGARGREEACKFWLEWAIPLVSDTAECLQMPDFDPVRGTPWFKQLVERHANPPMP